MIEIKCSKRQKETIIQSLLNPIGCLWPQSQLTCVCDSKMNCRKCFETRIKWTHPDRKKKKEDKLNENHG